MASAKAKRNKARVAAQLGIPVQRGVSVHTLVREGTAPAVPPQRTSEPVKTGR